MICFVKIDATKVADCITRKKTYIHHTTSTTMFMASQKQQKKWPRPWFPQIPDAPKNSESPRVFSNIMGPGAVVKELKHEKWMLVYRAVKVCIHDNIPFIIFICIWRYVTYYDVWSFGMAHNFGEPATSKNRPPSQIIRTKPSLPLLLGRGVVLDRELLSL